MKTHKNIRDMVLFAMFGALLFASKVVFELLPNIHAVSMLIMVLTLVYRKKALIPIYLFVLICGLYYGFASWWIVYLYIWAIQWATTMLLPQNMPKKTAIFVYPAICALFGLTYGLLYAPTQAVLYSYNFKTTILWIIAGLKFDILHAVGNLFMGILIIPLTELLKKLEKFENK